MTGTTLRVGGRWERHGNTIVVHLPPHDGGASLRSEVPEHPLTPADLGIQGTVRLNATFRVTPKGVAVVRIDYLGGQVLNPFDILPKVKQLARTAGASRLRIEANVRNPRLRAALERRFGFRTQQNRTFLDVAL